MSHVGQRHIWLTLTAPCNNIQTELQTSAYQTIVFFTAVNIIITVRIIIIVK